MLPNASQVGGVEKPLDDQEAIAPIALDLRRGRLERVVRHRARRITPVSTSPTPSALVGLKGSRRNMTETITVTTGKADMTGTATAAGAWRSATNEKIS